MVVQQHHSSILPGTRLQAIQTAFNNNGDNNNKWSRDEAVGRGDSWQRQLLLLSTMGMPSPRAPREFAGSIVCLSNCLGLASVIIVGLLLLLPLLAGFQLAF